MKRWNGIGSGATKAGPLLLLGFRDFDEKKASPDRDQNANTKMDHM